jgi:hypothetical protein
MHRRVGIALSVTLLTLLPGAAFAFPGGPKPLTDSVLIAAGQAFDAPVRISAYDSTLGLCIREFEGADNSKSVDCGPEAPLPPGGKAIEIDALGSSAFRHTARFSDVSGSLRTDVATVRVYFHRAGQRRAATAISGQVGAEDAARLHQSQLFGRFVSIVHGCVTGRDFKVVALAADGLQLGADRGFRTPGACHIPEYRGNGTDGVVVQPPGGRR